MVHRCNSGGRGAGAHRIRNGTIVVACLLLVSANRAAAQRSAVSAPSTGPNTEKRFPPLVVPKGFKTTLFACDPLIEYPSVIALGPRPGTVFVAHDYLTGLGVKIERPDEIRLLEDTDGDGYADKSTVFAAGLNSIQGLAYHAGTVYAMHAPFLTALRDTDGDGVADERRDLLTGLGLTPEKNEWRLHCANGVVVGHDGWLYLAVGDHGIDVRRPEGDQLVLHGGGILRCRPDGRDLHIFATGLRNIYDVALDEELNVFVRDNENDGGNYMVRVYHSFHGADHGYPYQYFEHPEEALPPLADLGRGSSAGGVCYLETSFPREFRGNLFFCEWGRSVVRYVPQRAGSGFGPMKELEFAAGAPNDPYGFKPTDVIVDRDGSLLVSDWADDQRPRRGRGRLYRIAYGIADEGSKNLPSESNGKVEDQVARLNSPSYFVRVSAQETLERSGREGLQATEHALRGSTLHSQGRMHAVWILAHAGGRERVGELVGLAQRDKDPRIRAQAMRALGDLCDPTLGAASTHGEIDSTDVARRLSEIARDQDPRVTLEIVVALGRLRWRDAPAWLRDRLINPDAALRHAAQRTLARAENWPAVLALLSERPKEPIREIALAALADRADPQIVDGLIRRLNREATPHRRRELADALTRVYKKPGPWEYWGYRPLPRPANSVRWERTDAIGQVLDGMLADSDRDVRMVILQRMQREHIPVRVVTLRRWLQDETVPEHVRIILASLASSPADQTRDLLEEIVRGRQQQVEIRRAALSQVIGGLDTSTEPRLLGLAKGVEDGPLRAEIIRELGKRPKIDSRALLLARLDSTNAEVRASAVDALAHLRANSVGDRVLKFLRDPDSRVRRAAAAASGTLGLRDSVGTLSKLARDDDPEVRGASLDSLRKLRSATAIEASVVALEYPAAKGAAIEYLAEFGTPAQADALAKITLTDRSIEAIAGIIRALAACEAREPPRSSQRQAIERAIAVAQGQSGVLMRWHILGPVVVNSEEVPALAMSTGATPDEARSVIGADRYSAVELDSGRVGHPDFEWFAKSDVSIAEPTRTQFLASSNCPMQIEINGRVVLRRAGRRAFEPNSDCFETELPKGNSRIIVRLGADRSARFHVCFRPLSSSAEHERLVRFALMTRGDLKRGRSIFRNGEKSLCAKCHRIGDSGNNIGPDLTEVGGRFSKIHLIESILEPSRAIAPGYESIAAELRSGRVVIGVKMAEDDKTLTLGDETGKRHEIRKIDIEQRTALRRSIMPDGLEKRLTDGEFVDLLAYLLSQQRSHDRRTPD
jgi:putative membrane-bound dehydrogenase-like protein